MRNDSVTPNKEKRILIEDGEELKDLESFSDKKNKQRINL